jgi:thiamine biosynthesis lipoprotein
MKKFLLIFSLGLMVFISCNQAPKKTVDYIKNSGETQGTYYSLVYLQPEGKDLQTLVEQKLKEFDASLSTYNPNSVISKINKNDDSVRTDVFFEDMYNQAYQVSEISHGAFDITVGPLVRAWGFGFDGQSRDKSPRLDTILPHIGYKKISLENHKLIKKDPKIMIDAGAIAQGQSSDVIGALLEANGCENFMVEIGGEVFCKGLNPKGKKWQIGIDKPVDDPSDENKELQAIVGISGVGLSTSGNYRQFYIRDGKKYAHEINPHTGFPVDHNLLSATVIAPNCMQADAFATAFMVVGVDSSLAICRRVKNIDCYLIYADKNGAFQVAQSEGFKKNIAE